MNIPHEYITKTEDIADQVSGKSLVEFHIIITEQFKS